MLVPWWKRCLSYLTEVHVESAPSDVNPHLYVSMRKGRFQLSTAHAIYSYEDLYTNFLYAFRQVAFNRLPGDDVLILGLGLGSIPLMLERVFHTDFRYLAVELDPSVIYLANTYALSSLQAPVTTICADAYSYIMQSEEQFSLICMDVFLDDNIPEHFQSSAYLEALSGALEPGGLLMFNRLYRNAEDKTATERYYREVFQLQFPNGTALDVGGNWILVNDRALLKGKA
ncbi:spermidine synthase [Phaeodactylibacter luteus]|uniref:Methyltransferase domain-containing protein n=1 Tax=Phaeodactylibacter luteus TaxID=1564516 RepID=A0A5C6RZR5_9BACT|nr:hypothetical protein [Phaeodactylibacter luteus]TXB67614.1 hypothetical protein FRY97_04265 [Phaeodactylibacter luteus]